jgi:hypothetical protein
LKPDQALLGMRMMTTKMLLNLKNRAERLYSSGFARSLAAKAA